MTDLAGITSEQIKILTNSPTVPELNETIGKLMRSADLTSGDQVMEHREELRRLGDEIEAVNERTRATLKVAREVGAVLASLTDSDKLMIAADATAQMAEIVSGYRNRMISVGFSREASEAMAIQFHYSMVAASIGTTSK